MSLAFDLVFWVWFLVWYFGYLLDLFGGGDDGDDDNDENKVDDINKVVSFCFVDCKNDFEGWNCVNLF